MDVAAKLEKYFRGKTLEKIKWFEQHPEKFPEKNNQKKYTKTIFEKEFPRGKKELFVC